MTTCEPLPDGGEDDEPLTLFAADSLASPFPVRVSASRRTTRAGSGPLWRRSFADYDPAMRSWRMFQGSLFAEWEMYSGTWPRAGMTRSGIAYLRQPSAPITKETASGSWPTPQARDHRTGQPQRVGSPARHGGWNLNDWAALWPTPQAHDVHPGRAERVGRHGTKHGGRDLNDWVARWPPPRSQNAEPRNHKIWRRPDGEPQNLENAIAAAEPSAVGGLLNPEWVEWLMGYPPGWTDCEGSGTPSCPRSPSTSAD